MKKYQGTAVSQGIAIGRIWCYGKHQGEIPGKKGADRKAEEKRFQRAAALAGEQYEALYRETCERAGKEQAEIFHVCRMLLSDQLFVEEVRALLGEGWNAEYAVSAAGRKICGQLKALPDDYMRERWADMADVAQRVLALMQGEEDRQQMPAEPSIVAAGELSPGDAMTLGGDLVLAFVTAKGSVNSHTAILARGMRVPALTGLSLPGEEELSGKLAAVDGFTGELFVEPEPEVLEKLRHKKEKWLKEMQELEAMKGMENCTPDGRRIDIYANIDRVEEVYDALREDAGGIGLMRSEFLYLGRSCAPTEEEQYQSYRRVIEAMEGRRVIIRTLDIGADKRVDYLPMEEEENPALGVRGIRFCLQHPELLRVQLRAIYRAAAYGNAAIMFPMITSLQEVKTVKEMALCVRQELQKERKEMGEAPLGIMVETPSAALLSEELAKEVDFFSIGTNDLTQYVLAADRQNPALRKLGGACPPAVLCLIEMTVRNAHKAGIRAGICGELAGDASLTGIFLAMGVDELSVSPGRVLGLRRAVRSLP